MAQKDPLVEYRGEGHKMFEELGDLIRDEVVTLMFHAELAPPEEGVEDFGLAAEQNNAPLQYQHESLAGADAIAAASAGGVLAPEAPPAVEQRVVSENEQIGRNDPCWCGSGKKYKKCHGA
jgi:preprotein translocase subunit SecA